METEDDGIVKFDTARIAREKGFDEPCSFLHYTWLGRTELLDNIDKITNSQCIKALQEDNLNDIVWVTAPSQTILQKWLREKHNIDVSVNPYGEIDITDVEAKLVKKYTYRVDNWNVQWSVHDGTGLVMPEHYHLEGDNYEEVFELGLQKALTLIK